MSGDVVHGTYGGAAFDLNRGLGELTWDGTQMILMRIDLINRIFGGVMAVPMFSALLARAAKVAGEDYALAFLLGSAPSPQGSGGNSWAASMPQALRTNGEAYTRARRQLAANPGNAALGADIVRRTADLRKAVGVWLNTLPPQHVGALWQRMHDLDVFGGWGKSEVVAFQREAARAAIRVADSFITRSTPYWEQQGFKGKRVCSFFEGYFLGEAQIILGRDDLVCIEQACKVEGAPACQFVIEHDASLQH